MYGHGYEIVCLAVSKCRNILASACKATNIEHAAIILWLVKLLHKSFLYFLTTNPIPRDTSTWTQTQKLQSHTLTVVQLAFSNDLKLLSVSRDRRWSVFTQKLDGTFELTSTVHKDTAIHTRIIWCCSWSHDSQHFATGSRDGKVVFWSQSDDRSYHNVCCIETQGESVTALAFAPDLVCFSMYLVAVGMECGGIELYAWNYDEYQVLKVFDRK